MTAIVRIVCTVALLYGCSADAEEGKTYELRDEQGRLVFRYQDRGSVPYPLLEVTRPAEGTVVRPGNVVEVQLRPLEGRTIGKALLLSDGTPLSVDVSTLPLTVQVTVPLEAAGDFHIDVFSQDPSGKLAPAIKCRLRVEAAGSIVELEVSPSSTVIPTLCGGPELEVTARYSDGVRRDVTDGSTGTTYASSDPTIVRVSKSGKLEPEHNGTATIDVRNGTALARSKVTVDTSKGLRCGNGIVDPGEDCDSGCDLPQWQCCTDWCKRGPCVERPPSARPPRRPQ